MTKGGRDSGMELRRHKACSGSALPACGKSRRFMHNSYPDGHDEAGAAFGTGELPRSFAPHYGLIGIGAHCGPSCPAFEGPIGSDRRDNCYGRYHLVARHFAGAEFQSKPKGIHVLLPAIPIPSAGSVYTRAHGSQPSDGFRDVPWQASASRAHNFHYLQIRPLDGASPSIYDENRRATVIHRRRRSITVPCDSMYAHCFQQGSQSTLRGLCHCTQGQCGAPT